jgi:hypothetical protein
MAFLRLAVHLHRAHPADPLSSGGLTLTRNPCRGGKELFGVFVPAQRRIHPVEVLHCSPIPIQVEPEQSGSGVGIVANDSCRRRVNSIAVACDKSNDTPFVKLAFTCGWLEPGRCIGITEVTCPKYAPTTTSPLKWR